MPLQLKPCTIDSGRVCGQTGPMEQKGKTAAGALVSEEWALKTGG